MSAGSAFAICCNVACEQLPARQAAGPPTGAFAARLRYPRFYLENSGGDQRPRQAKPNARGADREPMRQGDGADDFKVGVEHRIHDGRCNALPSELGKTRARRDAGPCATAARSARPIFSRLWRASTRTRLESFIGLSG